MHTDLLNTLRPHTRRGRLLYAARSPTRKGSGPTLYAPLSRSRCAPGLRAQTRNAARRNEENWIDLLAVVREGAWSRARLTWYSNTVNTENAKTARPYPWSRTEVRLPPAQSPFLLLGNPPSTGYSPGLRAHLRTNRAHRTAQALRRNGEGDGTLHTTPTVTECPVEPSPCRPTPSAPYPPLAAETKK